ncbi:unnamed protein product [Phaedon cochleariae]|uniref:3-hydroxyisobutyryl-CoA hydrolase, mitochondrial n=1 Tax=Phaedon cochleariae TaxID=80249 RepID=A0A9N9SCH1_PHACE|nr:unnamed protein product [Phaedon cochleariae]
MVYFKSIKMFQLNRTMSIATSCIQNFKASYFCTRCLSTARTINPDDIIAKDVDDKGVVTLNRPKSLNAITYSMITKLHKILKDWESKKTLAIIKGAGERAFCSGGDVPVLAKAELSGDKFGQEFFKYVFRTIGLIGSYRIPYISFIDGIVVGGGFGLSVHGHYRVATERTLFALPETQIGFFTDVGGSHFLPRLRGKLGYYLALTGHRLKGSDVLRAGIATHLCRSSDLNDLEQALMKCSNHEDIQKTLNQFAEKDVPAFSLDPFLVKIDDYFSSASMEEITAKLTEDGSEWANETIKSLNRMSPTSLKVVLRQLKMGESMNLKDCLDMEYILVLNFLNNRKDFYEGVRAFLVDKDKKPKWDPPTLPQVSEDIVDYHFAKVPNVGSIFKN